MPTVIGGSDSYAYFRYIPMGVYRNLESNPIPNQPTAMGYFIKLTTPAESYVIVEYRDLSSSRKWLRTLSSSYDSGWQELVTSNPLSSRSFMAYRGILSPTAQDDFSFFNPMVMGSYYLNINTIPNQPTNYGLMKKCTVDGSGDVVLEYRGLGANRMYIRTLTSSYDSGWQELAFAT
jgi:hypothetical protein